MKKQEICLYSFEELSEEAQKKVMDRERMGVAQLHDEFVADGYFGTMEKFAEITKTEFHTNYGVFVKCKDEYCDQETLEGKYLFRYVANEIIPYITRGKYFSMPGKYVNGKYEYKSRRSRVLSSVGDDCPLTGMCYDYDILKPLVDYYHNWARPEYDGYTFEDLMQDCYDAIYSTYEKDVEYGSSDDFVREELEGPNYDGVLYYEDGTRYEGPAFAAA